MAVTRPPPWDENAALIGPALHTRREGTRLVVSLGGEHDLSTAASITDILARATTDDEGDLVIDLSRVSFMDAAIVTVIVRSRNDLRLRSRDLRLRDPSPFAARILDLCGLLGMIDPAPTTGEDQTKSRNTDPGRLTRTRRLERVL
jgi:anti-sigma B factor antagonist